VTFVQQWTDCLERQGLSPFAVQGVLITFVEELWSQPHPPDHWTTPEWKPDA
jgi:hypothetical protein